MTSQYFTNLRQAWRWFSALFVAQGGTAEAAANEAESFREFTAENDFIPDKENWFQVAPYGEFPHSKGRQVFKKEDAENIVKAFNSALSIGKRIRGLAIYKGHPDADRASYPDDMAYGRIKELKVGADGLEGRAEFSANGKTLINEGAYDAHSPYWRFVRDPIRAGTIRPVELLSVGLTNQPNIPVRPITAANEKENSMNLLKALIALFGMGEAANETEVETKAKELLTAANELPKVKTKLTEAETKVTGLTTDLAAANTKAAKAETDLTAANAKIVTMTSDLTAANTAKDAAANALKAERDARTGLILDTAINSGRITAAERKDIEVEFAGAKDETAFNSIVMRVSTKKQSQHQQSMAFARTAANGKPGERSSLEVEFDTAYNELREKGKSHGEAWQATKSNPKFKALYAANVK